MSGLMGYRERMEGKSEGKSSMKMVKRMNVKDVKKGWREGVEGKYGKSGKKSGGLGMKKS